MFELVNRFQQFRNHADLARRSLQAAYIDHTSLFKISRPEIEDRRDKNFKRAFRHAVKNSRFYRTYYGDHRLLSRGDVSVEDLPILTKELLMDNFDKIITVKGLTRGFIDDYIAEGKPWIYKNKYLFVKSTGTSGYHTLNVYTMKEMASSLGLIIRRMPIDRPVGSRSAYLYGSDPSHLSYKFSRLRVPFVSEVKHIPTQWNVNEINTALEKFNPTIISSFPSSLKVLIEEVKAGRLRLKSGITVISSGEMLEKSLIQDFQSYLNTHPFNIYGSIEACPMAQDCSEHELHINEDTFILESDATGGLISNLICRTVPILRFRIDDIFDIERTSCRCGSNFKRLRLSDAKRTGQFFVKDSRDELKKINTMIFKDTLYKFTGVIQSQVHQYTQHDFRINVYCVRPSDDLKTDIKYAIVEELRAAAIQEKDLSLHIEFVQPSEMARKNGKVKQFIPWEWSK